jgi:hypothetical protein
MIVQLTVNEWLGHAYQMPAIADGFKASLSNTTFAL